MSGQQIITAQAANDRLRNALVWFSSIANIVCSHGKNINTGDIKKSMEFYAIYAETADERYKNMTEDFIKNSMSLR